MARSVRLTTASNIIDLGDFIQLLGMNGRSGSLTIRHADDARRLVLAEGKICAFDRRTGGAAAAAEADPIARRQRIVEGLLDVLAWEDPELEFVESSAVPASTDGGPPLSIQGLLLEVHQTSDLLQRIGESIPSLDEVYAIVPGRAEMYADSAYQHVIERLDGRRSVRRTLEGLGDEKYPMLERLATLVKKGVAQAVDALHLEMVAWEAESSGDDEEALRLYRVLRGRAPENARVLKNIAGVLAHLDRKVEAAAALAEYADVCLADDVPEEALRALRLASQFSSNDLGLLERYVDALERAGRSGELLAESLRLADRYAAAGDHILAKNALRRVLRAAPNHLGARERLARLCHSLGEEGAAVSELAQLAALQRRSGRLERARETCDEILRLDPGCLEGLSERVEVAFAEGDAPGAQRAIEALDATIRSSGSFEDGALPPAIEPLLRRYLELRPDDADALRRLGDAMAARGETREATTLRARLLDALSSRGDVRGAIEVLESLIRSVPDSFDLHAQLAEQYHQIGETKRAVAIYEFSGRGLLGAEQWDEAARVYGQLIELDPEGADSRLGFARALRGRGERYRAVLRYREAARAMEETDRAEDALDVLREALECEAGDLDTSLQLGALLVRRGEIRAALEVYAAGVRVARARGDEEAARVLVRRADRINPSSVPE